MKVSVTPTIIAGVAIVILIAVGIYALYHYSADSPLRIPIEQANSREFDVYLDVRTKAEVDSLGTFGPSTHIPASELEEKIREEVPDKNDSILVFCNTGQRARKAAEKLVEIGYRNVRYIKEGHASLQAQKQLEYEPVMKLPELPCGCKGECTCKKERVQEEKM
jgi:phage shock protein E